MSLLSHEVIEIQHYSRMMLNSFTEIHNAPDLVCLPYWDLDNPINLLQCHLHDEYVCSSFVY